MNSILMPVAPTLDELNAASVKARTELDRVLRQRADLDAGCPTEPVARAEWFESRARLPDLDAALFRARARSEQADAALKAGRERHYRDVRESVRPERLQLFVGLRDALETAAGFSRAIVELDADVENECDGHGEFDRTPAWPDVFFGPECRFETWKRIMRREGLLP